MSMLDQLVEMGFTKEKAELALKATQEKGLEQAMDWLIREQERLDKGPAAAVTNGTVSPAVKEERSTVTMLDEDEDHAGKQGAGGSSSGDPEQTGTEKEASADQEAMMARSMKCEDCGKALKDMTAAMVHAERTGHQNFGESVEEVKPLTAEDKARQMELLKQKIRERKTVADKEDREKLKDMERKRRLEGKDLQAYKEKARIEEMKKIAEEKKQEKLEEKRARQRVLDKIKADREASKAERAAAQGHSAVVHHEQPTSVVAPPPKQNYEESKLQIRLTNGSILTQTFGAKEPLASVRLWVSLNRSDGEGPFTLMTPFPRRVFTDADYDAPLAELGLVPSAVLTVTRAPAVVTIDQ